MTLDWFLIEQIVRYALDQDIRQLGCLILVNHRLCHLVQQYLTTALQTQPLPTKRGAMELERRHKEQRDELIAGITFVSCGQLKISPRPQYKFDFYFLTDSKTYSSGYLQNNKNLTIKQFVKKFNRTLALPHEQVKKLLLAYWHLYDLHGRLEMRYSFLRKARAARETKVRQRRRRRD